MLVTMPKVVPGREDVIAVSAMESEGAAMVLKVDLTLDCVRAAEQAVFWKL